MPSWRIIPRSLRFWKLNSKDSAAAALALLGFTDAKVQTQMLEAGMT